MTDSVLTSLCSAIVGQAVEDYRELSKKGVGHYASEDSGTYSKYEIEHFFKSKYAGLVLACMGSSVDGFTILRQLKKETCNI